ncbi:MAG TPA: DUF2306 domain-containing protein [Terricaulis sp.]|nr:DUF2306 domain-containing protein [Terricaulis sp.]
MARRKGDVAGGATDATDATGAPRSTVREALWGWLISAACFGAVALILLLTPGALNLGAFSDFAFKTPDLAPLIALSPLVQFHIYTAVAALLIGPVQFAMPKGTRTHRAVGWVWAACMGATAIATLFIRDMRDGAFSPIHLFSLMALIGLPWALWLARTGQREGHVWAMVGLYIGLVISGATALAPGRVMWDILDR